MLLKEVNPMLLYRLVLPGLKKLFRPLCVEVSQKVDVLVRAGARTPSSQCYLSPNGRSTLGPFPMAEVKWMIRCRHFSPDVLIRAYDESGWTSYRHHVFQATTGRVLAKVIGELRRVGLMATDEPFKSSRA